MASLLAFSLLFSALHAVPFVLRNNSLSSIPLAIPGVMNPNLSPVSNSSVDLKVGQKIYFFVKKKKYLLLEVNETLAGQTLAVDQLIRQRRKELGL